MKENEKFLKESIDLLSREFGQPLPTISSVMKKHQENLKEDKNRNQYKHQGNINKKENMR